VYEDQLLQHFTPHHHLVLEAVYQLTDPVKETFRTGNLYDHYTDLAATMGRDPLTARRISDYIDHLELLTLSTSASSAAATPARPG